MAFRIYVDGNQDLTGTYSNQQINVITGQKLKDKETITLQWVYEVLTYVPTYEDMLTELASHALNKDNPKIVTHTFIGEAIEAGFSTEYLAGLT